ncbi:MAG: SPFH domain-containing protein [Planctomycetes bacterium]|nr:SPFH domain-containing protein [Planctomycetota bacterium]
MGLWDSIKHQLIDIVQWLDETNDTMVFRFERYANEIKYGAKLVVRESQNAVFVNEGKIGDVFKPGTYTLTTQNLPILSTLLGWKYGFESPFKAEVYFVNTKRFTDLKWGTKNPIMLRDAEFGPLRLRAFGTYALRVKDPAQLIREIAGTNGRFTVEEITEQIRNMIVSRFADALGESKIAALDLAANYSELGDFLSKKIQPDFDPYGIEVLNLMVENISLPPEVEKVLDQRTSMGVIGNLQAYTQFQTANAIPDAAKNPGGLAAAGVGLGLGIGMAGQVAPAMAPNPGASAAPPPLPQTSSFFVGVGGQQAGPYDMQTLQQQVLSGRLTKESLVWKNGMPQWTAAGQVPELANLFNNAPPPLPKG